MNRKYVILESGRVPEINFSEVCETSAETLRFSNDSSQTLVKYEGEKPAFLEGDPVLTHREVLAVMGTPSWSGEAPN